MRTMSANHLALGLRALKGGAVAVAVAIESGEPRIVHAGFLPTSAEGDRLSLEPYQVAFELNQNGSPSDAAAAVAEGRTRQDRLAKNGLQYLVQTLAEAGPGPTVVALLVNRAGWVTDLLEYSLAWPEHVPVAEGLAVRDALRFASGQCGLDIAEVDEKSLPELAAWTLDMPSPAIDACLKALGATAGRPWRKEQKLACLAAWVTLSGTR